MIDERFVILGALISVSGTLSYALTVIKGETKPNKVSWFVWALAPLIAFSAQLSKGVQLVSLVTFMAGFGPLLILLASFVNKKSEWKLTKLDLLCGVLALLGLAAWMYTEEGLYAIAFGIAADLLAGVPTIVKSFNHPETENYRAFLASGIGSILGFLTIKTWNFENYSFPLYLILINALLFSLIRFRIGEKIFIKK